MLCHEPCLVSSISMASFRGEVQRRGSDNTVGTLLWISIVGLTCFLPSIASYINNVHPVHHAGVYSVLEKIIDKTIPLFNRCLTSIETPSRFYKTRIDVECTEYGDVPNREPGEYQTLEARTQWHYLRNKSRERPSVDLRKDFRDSGLQFIVEASSINMDPLLPDWDGDCGRSWWKMQGQLVFLTVPPGHATAINHARV